jgi:hypothetical protein
VENCDGSGSLLRVGAEKDGSGCLIEGLGSTDGIGGTTEGLGSIEGAVKDVSGSTEGPSVGDGTTSLNVGSGSKEGDGNATMGSAERDGAMISVVLAKSASFVITVALTIVLPIFVIVSWRTGADTRIILRSSGARSIISSVGSTMAKSR